MEWPDFARDFEPWGFGSACVGMRLCGGCVELYRVQDFLWDLWEGCLINSARTPCLQRPCTSRRTTIIGEGGASV